ncbi:MAG TPA: VWA domain-containing protein [Terriglobia bacterium]|nr:VWA domain-containing protein [Terriglobia bacterium]
MHRHNKNFFRSLPIRSGWLVLLFYPFVALGAQAPQPATPHTPPVDKRGKEYTITVNVNEVVLHATVIDKKGHIVNDLKQDDFKVFEDGAPQTLTHFSHADIPVTMGIVIDDSGSMRNKREAVNAAALIFAKTSNPQDQVFVVNFNDVYYLDTPGDFANTIEDLKSALDKIDSRGGTAMRDAVIASLDHLKLGNRDKKILLVITDGEDNASRYTQEELMERSQKSNAVIYTIGLLGSDETSDLFKIRGGEAHRAAKVLRELAEATGGEPYFPKSLDEVESTCRQIAHDIRNQYTLAYTPTNLKKDGTFRSVRVDAYMPHSKNKLVVRTRPGYFAPKPEGTPAVASK